MNEGMRKAQEKANQLLNKVRRERDRENLGYDKYQVLQEYCSEVGLSYSETSHILAYFEEGCGAL